MDPATLAALYTAFYTALGTLGLVAADTYINANTMYLETTVSEGVKEEGYEPEVVDGIFVAEAKKITSTPSLVAAPKIQSSKTVPVSAALAKAAGLESALVALQGLMGFIPPKMVASIIAEDQKQRVQVVQSSNGGVSEHVVGEEADLKLVLTGYDPQTGYFYVTVEGRTADEDVDELIKDAAFEAVLKLEPYLALLYRVNERAEAGEDLAPARKLIDEAIAAQPGAIVHKHRALLENLRGIVALLEQNQILARQDFSRAIASDPNQPVGFLNLAFLEVHEDHYQEAITLAEKVIHPKMWPVTTDPVLRASGYTIKGVAETEMGDYRAAGESFRNAVALNPKSSEVYVYWARMLRKAGRPAEAAEKFDMARQNSIHFENFPEMALLYFWLTEKGQVPLERRLGMVEEL